MFKSIVNHSDLTSVQNWGAFSTFHMQNHPSHVHMTLFAEEYKDDETYRYTFEQEFWNEEVRGEIHVKKTDKDTRSFVPQGDAQLVGAEYGLYAAEDIESPDK